MTSRRSAKRRYGSLLPDDQLLDPLVRQRQHRVQLSAIVWRSLRGRLQLDQPSILDHHTVQIRRRLEVLRVVEVQHRHVLDDPAPHPAPVPPHLHLPPPPPPPPPFTPP